MTRPCEQCGSEVVTGEEVMEGRPGLVEWCVNLDCPSNALPPGLHRVGVIAYTCDTCGATMATGAEEALAHLRAHRAAGDLGPDVEPLGGYHFSQLD